jgi:hypothetical protein
MVALTSVDARITRMVKMIVSFNMVVGIGSIGYFVSLSFCKGEFKEEDQINIELIIIL